MDKNEDKERLIENDERRKSVTRMREDLPQT